MTNHTPDTAQPGPEPADTTGTRVLTETPILKPEGRDAAWAQPPPR
jgi:hypothetical protein